MDRPDKQAILDNLISDDAKPLPPEIEEFRGLIKDMYNTLYIEYLPSGRESADQRAKEEIKKYFSFLRAFK